MLIYQLYYSNIFIFLDDKKTGINFPSVCIYNNQV